MKTAKTVSLVLISAALAGCGTVSAPTGGGAVDSGTTFAHDALATYVDRGELPGAISIFYDNGVQETCCIGYADVEAKRPITLDDVFMQCSQTKGFCGVTIAKLIEEGRLNLDDPVSKYLPEFNRVWYMESDDQNWRKTLHCDTNLQVTVRMVMNHTAGFEFELPGKSGSIRGGGWTGGMDLRQVAAEAAGRPLQFRPGTAVQYSNTGIDVGAAIVEAITGKPWEQYLKETVLDPLGMTATGFRPSDKQLETQIELYQCKAEMPAIRQREADMQRRPYNGPNVHVSAGAGLWTTVRDQLKFYKMLMNLGVGDNGVRILQESTVKNLLAVSSRPAGLGGYSLGLTAPEKDEEDSWFGHGGAWGTHCEVNWHRKQLKLWAVQLLGEPRPWNRAIWDAEKKFFGRQIDNSNVRAYTGRVN